MIWPGDGHQSMGPGSVLLQLAPTGGPRGRFRWLGSVPQVAQQAHFDPCHAGSRPSVIVAAASPTNFARVLR